MAQRYEKMIVIGMLVVAITAVGGILGASLLKRPSYVLEAANARGLQAGDPVEVAGVRVGAVTKVNAADRRVWIEFRFDERRRHLTTTELVRIEKPLLSARAKVTLVEPCSGNSGPRLDPGSVVREADRIDMWRVKLGCRFGGGWDWLREAAEDLRDSEAVQAVGDWVRGAAEYAMSAEGREDAARVAADVRRIAEDVIERLRREGQSGRADSIVELIRQLGDVVGNGIADPGPS